MRDIEIPTPHYWLFTLVVFEILFKLCVPLASLCPSLFVASVMRHVRIQKYKSLVFQSEHPSFVRIDIIRSFRRSIDRERARDANRLLQPLLHEHRHSRFFRRRQTPVRLVVAQRSSTKHRFDERLILRVLFPFIAQLRVIPRTISKHINKPTVSPSARLGSTRSNEALLSFDEPTHAPLPTLIILRRPTARLEPHLLQRDRIRFTPYDGFIQRVRRSRHSTRWVSLPASNSIE